METEISHKTSCLIAGLIQTIWVADLHCLRTAVYEIVTHKHAEYTTVMVNFETIFHNAQNHW